VDVDMLTMILGSIMSVFFVMALGYIAGWTRDAVLRAVIAS